MGLKVKMPNVLEQQDSEHIRTETHFDLMRFQVVHLHLKGV